MLPNVDAKINNAHTLEGKRNRAVPSTPVIGELLPIEQVVADINGKAKEPGLYKTSMAAEAAVLAIGALIQEKSIEEHNKFNALKSEWEARIDKRDNEFKQLIAKFEKKDEEKEEVVRELKREHFRQITQISTTHKKTIQDLTASFESEKTELILLHKRDIEDTVARRTKDKTFILTEEISRLKEQVNQLQLEKKKAADESMPGTPTGDDSGFLYSKTRRRLFGSEAGTSTGTSSPEPADFEPATKPEPLKPELPKPEPKTEPNTKPEVPPHAGNPAIGWYRSGGSADMSPLYHDKANGREYYVSSGGAGRRTYKEEFMQRANSRVEYF